MSTEQNQPIQDQPKAGDVINLQFPVKHSGEELTELKVSRRLLAGDFRGIKTDEILFDDMFTLIARLFAVPTSVVHQLDATDLFQCVGVVKAFLPSGPQIGDS
jgi:hypothetical protein